METDASGASMVGCAQALRLYPPAFMITRYGEEAVTIDGCPMPQG